MSWSASFKKPVEKRNVDSEIDGLTIDYAVEPPAHDQLRTAKQAAKLIVANVPGPYINVTLNGHANGVGWQKKEGWANDSISVTVTQITEEDLKYYQ